MNIGTVSSSRSSTLSSSVEITSKKNPLESYYLLRAYSKKTGNPEYASAQAVIEGDSISLIFEVKTKPFKYMKDFLRSLPEISNDESAEEAGTAIGWVQPLKQGVLQLLEEELDQVKKVSVDVTLDHSPDSGYILQGIGQLCRNAFRNMNLDDSFVRVRHTEPNNVSNWRIDSVLKDLEVIPIPE